MDILSLIQQIIGQQQQQANPDPGREAVLRRMQSFQDAASQQPQQNPNFMQMPHQTMQLPQMGPVAPPVNMPQIGPPGQPTPMPMPNYAALSRRMMRPF